jgi:hypothetical protein
MAKFWYTILNDGQQLLNATIRDFTELVYLCGMRNAFIWSGGFKMQFYFMERHEQATMAKSLVPDSREAIARSPLLP